MLKRTITGACYAIIIFSFFLLREVDYRLFDVLIYTFSILGTYEMARALKPYLVYGNYNTLLVYGTLLVPTYITLEYIIEDGSGSLVIIASFILALAFAIVCYTQKKDRETMAMNILPYFYPAIFMLAMLMSNDYGQDKGFICLLLPFVTSALCDTFAYFTGSLIGGKKLCPKLSPKKTWSGAIGGIVGGIVGALLVFFIFNNRISVKFPLPALLFVIIGIVASVLTIFGDLFESFIKRKVGIKDMGSILPGHGGVLDRIDSTMFVSLFVCALFMFV